MFRHDNTALVRPEELPVDLYGVTAEQTRSSCVWTLLKWRCNKAHISCCLSYLCCCWVAALNEHEHEGLISNSQILYSPSRDTTWAKCHLRPPHYCHVCDTAEAILLKRADMSAAFTQLQSLVRRPSAHGDSAHGDPLHLGRICSPHNLQIHGPCATFQSRNLLGMRAMRERGDGAGQQLQMLAVSGTADLGVAPEQQTTSSVTAGQSRGLTYVSYENNAFTLSLSKSGVRLLVDPWLVRQFSLSSGFDHEIQAQAARKARS